MKKLILLFILILLTGCQLVKTTEKLEVKEPFYDILGFRIRVGKLENGGWNYKEDLYYINEKDSPFISNFKYEEYTEDGSNFKHTTIDYQLVPNKCTKIDFISKDEKGNIYYDDNLYTCGVGLSSTSIAHTVKTNKINETIKLTVNLIPIKKLLEYTIVEYDTNNELINNVTIDLNKVLHEITINEDTAYYKIITKFKDTNQESKVDIKLITIQDLQGDYSSTVYSYNDLGERIYYQIRINLNQ